MILLPVRTKYPIRYLSSLTPYQFYPFLKYWFQFPEALEKIFYTLIHPLSVLLYIHLVSLRKPTHISFSSSSRFSISWWPFFKVSFTTSRLQRHQPPKMGHDAPENSYALSAEHTVTYLVCNWAMPHKFFDLHAIKIYTHKTLAEELYIKCKHTNTSVNTHIQTKIKINIYMQHI